MADYSALVAQLQSEFQFVAVRSRGPGGQNVNKVSSAALLFWNFEDSALLNPEQKSLLRRRVPNVINKDQQIYLRSDEFRDLHQNKSRCMEKLAELLARAFHRDKPRKPSRPTKASKVRKQESKVRRSEIKKGRAKGWDRD